MKMLTLATVVGISCGAAAVASFELADIPQPKAQDEAQFDEAWNDTMKVVELKKAGMLVDRKRIAAAVEEASTEPKPVVTEHIVPDAAPVEAPVAVAEKKVKERQIEHHATKRKQHHKETNVCTRHGMRKVVTRGGRSWRCRR